VIEVANAPVTEDGSQTLTGKTMSGSSNTFSNLSLTSSVTGTLPVANGGTGQTTYTNGQLLIGNSTGNTLAKATLTAGSGITVTNGSGSITVAASNVPGSSVSGQYAPRVSSQASPASISVDVGTYDQYVVTALANSLSFPASTTGSPTNGNKIIIRIKDDGTARALSWTTSGSGSYRAIGVTLPTTTVISKVLYVGCIYNSTESYWDVVAVNLQA